MISVENFYWILYHNLLAPADLDAWYYSPFGTQNLLVQYQYRPLKIKSTQHVLFHFDQEPLYHNDLGEPYEREPANHNSKVLRVLANSEKSTLKKQICRDRGMMDWYFFYHGFAALDWFRDSQYITGGSDPQWVYLSFNHLIRHRRSYRMSLLARLAQQNLLGHGKVSFHGVADDCREEILDPHSLLSQHSKNLIDRYLCVNEMLPLVADRCDINGSWSARLGVDEYNLWQQAFVHVVNETVFYDAKLHLTEKIFKPIVSLRPFILTAAPNNLAYLRTYGFKTFGEWIDESYDSVIDPDQRLDMIAYEIAKLSSMPNTKLKKMYRDMLPILEHNKKHFFGEFRNIIVKELVDNFDACLRQWNNGRVDGRNLPLANTDRVKQLLSRG